MRNNIDSKYLKSINPDLLLGIKDYSIYNYTISIG